MDYDAVMLYVKENPSCTSLDLSEAFGVTVAKAFTFMNKMVSLGLAYKTIVRSPTNNKKIFGYRVIDGFDEVDDSEEEMPKDEILTIARRQIWLGNEWEAALFVASCNEWRKQKNVELIEWREVTCSTYNPTATNKTN